VLWIAGGEIADPRPREGALRIEGALITGRSPRLTVKPPKMSAHGLVLAPAIIDAHVHLSVAGEVARVAREELRRGVAAVLDLGAPEGLLGTLDQKPLRVCFSGPLFTAPGGYPTQSWGKGGHGLALSSPDEARAAVARLAKAGARFIKLAFDPRYPLLAPRVAAAAAAEAHKRGLRVAAHALEADSVRLALDAGADVLAHTPRDVLPEDLLERMKGKWVISTLHAFGVAPARLAALREAGARIAYGTDLGHEDTQPGIDARELALLLEAGVDPLRAATRDAAELLGLEDLGRLTVGSTASLIALRGLDPESLARPAWVMICGKLVA
jgi:imidazolonepropionase-like amidohydrolase